MATVSVNTAAPTVQHLPGTSNIPLTNFPEPEPVEDVDPAFEVERVVDLLNKSFSDSTFQTTADLFTNEGYWRDHLVLSWAFRTVQSPEKIATFLKDCAKSRNGFRLKHITIDKSSSVRQPALGPLDGEAKVHGISAFLSIESVLGNGEGLIRLARQGGRWKIFTIYTSLRSLKGHSESTFSHRPQGVDHGEKAGRQNWADRRSSAIDYNDGSSPAVLIIGR